MAAYYTTFPALALCVPRIRGTPAVRRSGPSRIPARVDTGVRRQGDSIYLSIDCQPTSLDTLLQDLQEILSHKGHKDRKDCKTM